MTPTTPEMEGTRKPRPFPRAGRASIAVAALMSCAAPALAQEAPASDGAIDIVRAIEQAAQPGQISTTLLVFLLITVLSLAPAILVMTTSFTRIIVVLGFLRQAMATQQTPPNQVLIGLALFLSFFIMAPTYQRVYDEAVQPYMNGDIGQTEAFSNALKPIREFMFRQTDARDLALFLQIAKLGRPDTPDDVPTHVLVPAFAISELRTAFQIGFLIYIPFLIIDMVVASTLMSMGMLMLPPVFVSLPFKIIMFVLADGWGLITRGLVSSFFP